MSETSPTTPSPLEYMADLLYRRDCGRKGCRPVRWQCLNEEMKANYLQRAQALVNEWWEDEESARKRREEAQSPTDFFV